MFARLSIYENVDLDLADQVKQWVETNGDRPLSRASRLPRIDDARRPRQRTARSASASTQAPAKRRKPTRFLTTMFKDAPARVPESIRPALDMRAESVGLYEIVHRD